MLQRCQAPDCDPTSLLVVTHMARYKKFGYFLVVFADRNKRDPIIVICSEAGVIT